MFSFSRQTLQVLAAGSLVLGAGVFYQKFAAQRLLEAERGLRSEESAVARLATAQALSDRYLELHQGMASQKVDRQEPFAVDSEFSPQEIKQIAPLLDTLYQRDGLFFLRRFEIAWRQSKSRQGLLPRVVLKLEGEKVLLFSDKDAAATSVAAINQRGAP